MSMEIDPRIIARYETLLHAMQSGVAMMEQLAATGQARAAELEPKHLRVGVNSAMIETSSLGRLLVEKGVFTWDEYWASIIVTLEAEVASYEEKITGIVGRTIKLGGLPR